MWDGMVYRASHKGPRYAGNETKKTAEAAASSAALSPKYAQLCAVGFNGGFHVLRRASHGLHAPASGESPKLRANPLVRKEKIEGLDGRPRVASLFGVVFVVTS